MGFAIVEGSAWSNWLIVLWDSVDFMAVNLLLLSLVGLVLLDLSCKIIDFASKSLPDVLESEPETFVEHNRWSVNGSNLSTFPKEWLNPADIDSISHVAIIWHKDDLLEALGSDDTVLDNLFVGVEDSYICNWSSKVHCSGSELLGLLGLDLCKRKWLIWAWDDLILNAD